MLLDLALKNLVRRKFRSILTILGVMIAVQLYLLLSGVGFYYKNDMEHQLSVFTGKVFIQQTMEGIMGSVDFTGSGTSLDEDTATALMGLDGVDPTSSSPVLFVPVVRASIPFAPPAVLIVGLLPGHESTLLAGSAAASGKLALTEPDSVILGSNAALHYQAEKNGGSIKAGQSITLEDQKFQVAGVIESSSQLLNGAVIMPLSSAQTLYERGSSVSAVILTASSVENAQSSQTSVKTRYPDLTASTQDDFTKNAQLILIGLRTFFSAINLTVLIVAGVLITIVMVVAVMEQRREIGTLRAIGARRWRIFGMVAIESIGLSLAGSILAYPSAILFLTYGWKLGSVIIMDILTIWQQAIIAAVLVGVFASLIPAWQAVHVNPLESLRYE